MLHIGLVQVWMILRQIISVWIRDLKILSDGEFRINNGCLFHRLRVVRRLVTARSSSLHRASGTLCHPTSLRLRHSASSSVAWKRIFLQRHSLNFPNCAHRIFFYFKSVLDVIFTQQHSTDIRLIIIIMLYVRHSEFNQTRTRLSCKTQHISTPWSWSIYTTGRRYCLSLRPCAVAWSNYLSWSEPRPPCVRRQFGVLLLATTASTSSPITRRRIGSHTVSRLCYVQGWFSTAICCWPEHQSLLPTSCSGSWTLQRELWAARRSTTAAWHTCFTLNCICSVWQIESHTSLGWRCTSACMARHRIICLSCAHWSLKLMNDSIFVPLVAIYSLFHGFSLIRTAVAPSLSLDQRLGTCSKTICMSRTCKLTVFVVHWRRFFWSVLGTLSTLEAFLRRCTI